MRYVLKSVLLALQNIKANPLHTFLSTLGIIIGVASLVAILALGDGLEETGREQLANTTSLNILSVTSNAYQTVDDIRIRVEDRPSFSVQQANLIAKRYADRAKVELMSQRTGQIQYGDSSAAVYVQGNMQNILSFVADSVRYGRYFSVNEIQNVENVAVLTNMLVASLGVSPEKLLGETILLNKEEFTVVGIFKEKEPDAPFMHIPISTFQQSEESFPALNFKVAKAEEIPAVEEEVKIWLDEEFEVGSAGFSITSNRARVEQFSRGILLFKLIMGAITGISVLVGGIGVMNVLLISVTERTKEIGIRKATGAKKKDIILQFMSESVTISLVGSAVGWVVGIIGVKIFVPIVNNLSGAGFNAAVRFETALLIFGIATVIGVMFGTYPAWRASQLNPIDAIRHE